MRAHELKNSRIKKYFEWEKTIDDSIKEADELGDNRVSVKINCNMETLLEFEKAYSEKGFGVTHIDTGLLVEQILVLEW